MKRKIENPFLYVEVSDRGAELMRIMRKDTGAEVLWNGDPAFWSYRSPILFPNVGSTWQKKMKINGKEYQTRQHGFAREKEFTCVEESTEKLRYRLMSDEETRKYYPFDFVLWITYELREKEILVSWEVENRSGEVMSFTIGGHPGFRFEKEGEQKEDYELYFPENTELTATAVDLVNGTGKPDQKYRVKLTDHTLVLSDQLFDVDTLVVDDAQIREVWLVVSMNFAVLESGPFRKDRMSVWNPGREDVMMKGFAKIFPKSRESTGRSRENAGKNSMRF